MKKIVLLFSVICLVFGLGSKGYAQEKGIGSVNLLLGLVSGILNVEYDHKLNPDTSVAGRILYWGYKTGDWKWSAFGAGASYRLYQKKEAMKGLYYGPSVDILTLSAEYTWTDYTWVGWTLVPEEKTEKADSLFITLAGDTGYRWVFKNQITIDLGVGFGYTTGSITIAGTKIPFGGTVFRTRANVGYAF